MTIRENIACPVCGEDFSDVRYSRGSLKVHYWRKHTDYPAFVRKGSIRMIVLDSPAVAVLIAFLLYFRPTDYFLLYIITGYVIYVGTILLNFASGLRNYKRRWAVEHNTQEML